MYTLCYPGSGVHGAGDENNRSRRMHCNTAYLTTCELVFKAISHTLSWFSTYNLITEPIVDPHYHMIVSFNILLDNNATSL